MQSQRLVKEFMMLQKKPIDGVSIKHKNKEGTIWDISIKGPTGSPYEGGTFHVQGDFTDHYPFKPPLFQFTTRIYHLNVQKETGKICRTIYEEDWKPVQNAGILINIFKGLLDKPNFDAILENDIAIEFKENFESFKKKAAEWVKNYAIE